MFCFFCVAICNSSMRLGFVYRLLSATWWRTQSSIHRGGKAVETDSVLDFQSLPGAKHIVTPIRFSAAAWPTRFLEYHSSSSHSSPSFTTLLGLPLKALMFLSDGVSSAAVNFYIREEFWNCSLNIKFMCNKINYTFLISLSRHKRKHAMVFDSFRYY